MVVKLNRANILTIVLVLFPICGLASKSIPLCSNYDELVGLISTIYVISLSIQNRLFTYERRIVFFLIMVTILGLMSNVLSHLISKIFPIFVDVLWLYKTFMCYIAFKHFVTNNNCRLSLVHNMVQAYKIIFLLLLALCIINQFVDIGVAGNADGGTVQKIGGFTPFGFFWNNGLQTGWLVWGGVLFLYSGEYSKKNRKYFLAAAIISLSTLISTAYAWLFFEVALLYIAREKRKINIMYFIILGIGVTLIIFSDIQAYFFEKSARSLLIRYGIVTANTYFPFGSGFATYGTEMAARYYSPLYVQYGWQFLWGMGQGSTQYLNDTFLAGILGQFGWIGLLLYIGSLYYFYKDINSKNLSKGERATSVATVLTIIGIMTISASVKSIMGIYMFCVLGIITSKTRFSCSKQKAARELGLSR